MFLHIISSYFLFSAVSVYACPGLIHRSTNGNSSTQTPPSIATRIKPATPTGKIALTNVRVFDGYGVSDPRNIFIHGTLISDDLDDVDSIIDGESGILLPGLIESHAHPDSTSALETLSSYGVTTVLNMNCIDYEVCSSLRDQTGLTSFFTAGYSAKGPNSSHAINSHAPASRLISTPEQAPLYVQEVFGNGSDWLKIVSELHGPDQATQNALVLQAHAMGRKVMTHAADLNSYIMAIESGADGPQHMPLDGILNDTWLEKMHLQHQYATPTMNVFYQVLHIPNAAASLGHTGSSFDEAWALVKKNVLVMKTAGIPILAGTDATPEYAGIEIPFGTTLHDELYYLVEAGLSPMEAVRAATLTPALAHNLGDRGRIEVGRRADLVLLKPDADPFTHINDTRKIQRVWNGGLEYKKLA